MLVFTGDINATDTIRDFGFGIGSKIKKGYNPFQNIKKSASDIWIGNFEGVLSSTSNKSGIFNKIMRLEPGYFDNGLIDYFGMANNHVMEHGENAFNEMANNLNCISRGAFGSNTKKSITITHDGKHIGIAAFCFRIESHSARPLYWHNPTDKELEIELEQLRDCDIRIAYIHWGVEFVTFPSTEQKRLAHRLVDMGFDLIIGMHPHVLQGYEEYNGKYIFYSLGNFLFNFPWKPGRYSAIVYFDVTNMTATPQYIYIDDEFHPTLINEEKVPEQLHFTYLNNLLLKDLDPEKYASAHFKALKQYRKDNRLYITYNLFRHNIIDIIDMSKDFIRRKLK